MHVSQAQLDCGRQRLDDEVAIVDGRCSLLPLHRLSVACHSLAGLGSGALVTQAVAYTKH